MLGRISENEKKVILQEADIFCSPAHSGESFGITVVEAMSAGTPVIAAANRGYKTILAEQAAHCLFEPGNVPELTDRLTRLIEDPNLRNGLAEWGQKKSVQHDVKNWVEKFEALYGQAIEKRQSS